MMGLQDKVILVTGAASGIGAAIARRLAEEGSTIIVTDRDGNGAVNVASSINGVAFEHDVAREESWESIMQDVLARFGRLDGLVNNAGIGGKTVSLVESTLAEWQDVFAVNAAGVYLGARFAMCAMQDGPGGGIVNIASLGALQGSAGHAAYCASKAAVVSLSRTAALEGSRSDAKIRVNAVCPGFVDTPAANAMVDRTFGDSPAALARFYAELPLGPGQPQDVAAITAFLLSDDARWITGATYVVDGGMSS